MKKAFLFLFITLGLGNLFAQTFTPNLSAKSLLSPKDNVTTIKILAVIADFQQDKDDATTGNGKFGSIYSKDYGQTILDPLPHDNKYFQAHLEFVKNYYRKASKGKVVVEFTVLPSVITVSKTMKNYSPASKSEDFKPLGDFAAEVWKKADSINPGFNFSDYNTFIIFHAGVGRDISLPGSLGIERDLPSIYMSLASLQKYYNDNSFKGFPVSNNFYIENTAVMPETESRELSSYNTNYLFQITINGLLVSTIASRLRLPDLFDTKTGLSAIGRFGLMDGQSIFAYNGLFPPQPSAWEKIYLGWAEPIETNLLSNKLSLSASETAGAEDTTILKVQINPDEYFLLENRQRDVNKDGAKLKLVINGDTVIKTFPKDTTGFYSYAVDSVYGVLVDIDELDWALPGSGILIWHIDDKVINDNIGANTINTNKEHRGVDVVEADGIKEIGEKFTTLTGDVVIGEGSDLDLWYAGNKGHFYTNKFNKDTRPSSRAFDGTNSQISISNFSAIANKMTADISIKDSLMTPVLSIPLSESPLNIIPIPFTRNYFTYYFGTQKLSAYINGNKFTSDDFSTDDANTTFITKNDVIVAGKFGNKLNFAHIVNDSLIVKSITIDTTGYNDFFATTRNDSVRLVIVKDLKFYFYDLNNFPENGINLIDSLSFAKSNLFYMGSASMDDYSAIIASDKPYNGNYSFFDSKGNVVAFKSLRGLKVTKNKSGEIISILTAGDGVYVVNNGKITSTIKFESKQTSPVVIGDIKGDGENYILYMEDNLLYARNMAGSMAENFPMKLDVDLPEMMTVPLPHSTGVHNANLSRNINKILVGDVIGDSKAEIMVIDYNGKTFMIDGKSGKINEPFPVCTNISYASYPILSKFNGESDISIVTQKSTLDVYKIGTGSGTIQWAGPNSNLLNNNFVLPAGKSNFTSSFFPENKAYNYPNPVYGTSTTIRYFVNEDSKVNIKIFDLAGDLAGELNQDARGGYDNEIIWNVEKIQSGVYLARIKADGVSGKSANKVIKIAIIK
ncbi:MAG: T9SS type A sorting domain-containing protein [Bacteroidota bacterium]|nr:T9SS type A sorting domain-containing protein [Bacteroidota bacterium]